MAPSYANLFMADLEERLLADYDVAPILWKRYLDDVFCVWPGTPDSFKEFVGYLNSKHPTIKFTFEASQVAVDYLDLTLYKGDRFRKYRILDIKPFFKKTNKFQYLQFSSSHPRRTFRAVVKGEHLRLLRACSDEATYTCICNKMYRLFRDRGYPPSLLTQVQEEVTFPLRQMVLLESGTPTDAPDTFFVTKFSSDLDVPQLKNVLKPLPHEEPFVSAPCVSLKNQPNIKKRLVRARLSNVQDPPKSNTVVKLPMTPILLGQYAGCGMPNCKCCNNMSRKVRIVSSHNK